MENFKINSLIVILLLGWISVIHAETQGTLEGQTGQLIQAGKNGTPHSCSDIVEKLDTFFRNQHEQQRFLNSLIINLTDKVEKLSQGQDGHSKITGINQAESSSIWPRGTVYYSVDNSFGQESKDRIQQAINVYETRTCVRWIPRSDEASYVSFQKANGRAASFPKCFLEGKERTVLLPDTNILTVLRAMAEVSCYTNNTEYESRREEAALVEDTSFFLDFPRTQSPFGLVDAEILNELYNCPGRHSYRFITPDPNSNPSNMTNLVVGQSSSDSRTEYVCRLSVGGDIVIGFAWYSTSDSELICLTPRGDIFGEYRRGVGFQLLATSDVATGQGKWRWWSPISDKGDLKVKGVVGGRKADGELLYVARCEYIPKNFHTGYVAENSPAFMRYAVNNLGSKVCPLSSIQLLVRE